MAAAAPVSATVHRPDRSSGHAGELTPIPPQCPVVLAAVSRGLVPLLLSFSEVLVPLKVVQQSGDVVVGHFDVLDRFDAPV